LVFSNSHNIGRNQGLSQFPHPSPPRTSRADEPTQLGISFAVPSPVARLVFSLRLVPPSLQPILAAACRQLAAALNFPTHPAPRSEQLMIILDQSLAHVSGCLFGTGSVSTKS